MCLKAYQIWPCRKIGQGQSRVIIWIKYDRLESQMLHTKFCGNRSTGSREEDFWRVFTIYCRGRHLGHETQMRRTNFRSPYPWRLHTKLALIGQMVSEMFEIVDDDGWTPDHGYTISSPGAFRSGELIKQRVQLANRLANKTEGPIL